MRWDFVVYEHRYTENGFGAERGSVLHREADVSLVWWYEREDFDLKYTNAAGETIDLSDRYFSSAEMKSDGEIAFEVDGRPEYDTESSYVYFVFTPHDAASAAPEEPAS